MSSPANFFNTSGAAHNYSRFSGPFSDTRPSLPRTRSGRKDAPSKGKKAQEGNKTATSLPLSPLQLDLENFDDPRHEESDFVLTSPRSLDACAKLGVKPVDLLYKNLQDYEEEHPEWSVKEIFALYESEESQRKDLLKRARQIRNRLIEEGISQSAGQMVKDAKSGSNALKKMKSRAREKSATPALPSKTKSTEDLRRSRPSSVTSGSSSRAGSRQRSELLRNVQKVVKDEDRKQLELMVSKREDEIATYEKRRDSLLEADTARQKEQAELREKEEARRRQAAQADYEWRLKQERLRHDLASQSEKEARELQKIITEREENHERMLELQRRQQEREIWDKKRQQEARRLKVSNNLAEAESQLEEYQNSVRCHSERAIEESVMRKLRKELSESQQKKLENIMKQEAFRYRKMASEKKKDLQIDDVRHNLDIRNAMVQKNQQHLAREQQRIKAETASERQKRINSAQERRKNLEEERRKYQSQLNAYHEMSFERASQNLQGKLSETAQRIHDQQNMKSEQHRMKLEAVRKTEEEWKAETAQLLNAKEEKVRQLQEEREAKLRENRLMAYTAERLRQEIRKAYGQDTFDTKLGQVTQLNRMGLGGSDQLA